MNIKKAVILLSGGLDSTTCLALASDQGYECHALSFSYGQKHDVELNRAKDIAKFYHVKKHHVIDLPTDLWGESALVNAHVSIPDFKSTTQIAPTYVPARNTIFLSFALGLAENLEAESIFIGVSSVDYSGYPDCRPEYIASFQAMANLATQSGVENQPTTIQAPLLHLSKAETIELGLSLGVDYSQTISCYRANEKGGPCGSCDSCALRQQGFAAAGVPDPSLG